VLIATVGEQLGRMAMQTGTEPTRHVLAPKRLEVTRTCVASKEAAQRRRRRQPADHRFETSARLRERDASQLLRQL
jgi:hypothetical protein